MEFFSLFDYSVYQAPFLAIAKSISAQTLNKYCAVVVHISTCFSKKKVMRSNKINSTEKIYDVNCLYIQYLSKIHTKIT